MANVTWDPSNKGSVTTLTNGNLTATSSAGSNYAFATSGQSAGKFYFEITPTTANFALSHVGVAEPGSASATATLVAYLSINTSTSAAVVVGSTTVITTTTYGTVSPAFASGQAIGVAVDLDNQTIWFRSAPSANWNGSATANPATNTGGVSFAALGAKGISLEPFVTLNSASGVGYTLNAGDTAFSGTVPSGFTSGFPTGGTNNALITQVGSEVWRAAPSDARFTQIGVEVWGSALNAQSEPGAGHITFTGFAPTNVISTNLPIPAGSITFTGYAPTSRMDTAIDVPVGSITFFGFAPTNVLEAAGGSAAFVCIM